MEPNQDTTATAERRRRIRLRLAVAAILVLIVAIIALTPPLVNLNRLQRRIAANMSASLGRPVHIDPNVTFHILPMPGFTLTNFVVSEDPAFGNEPVIRANVVTAQLRLSSLWRKHVEFSSISFDVDPNGGGASLNIVRNASGHWNLESLLMHAARIEAAPTTQRKAGDTPRFPYIEARGARINLKLGDEKMPFSLTDAEFALWLPTAKQWQVRLRATPSRTDSNVADPGVIRVEGVMQHAPSMSAVPIDLTASWHDAPLGEASRLLTGHDAGWRGTLHLDTTIRGTLGAAALSSRLTFNDLRRADFVPAHPLDVSLTCAANASAPTMQIADAHCSLPGQDAPPIRLNASGIDLRVGSVEQSSIEAKDVPLAWVYGWFKVLSPHTPQELQLAGTVDAQLTYAPKTAWDGTATVTLPQTKLDGNNAEPLLLHWTVTPPHTSEEHCPQSLALTPATAVLGTGSSMTFSGELSRCGYSYHASGEATPNHLRALGADLPTLAEDAFTTLPETAKTPQRVDVTCSRPWGQPQTCVANEALPARKRPAGKHRR